MKKKLVSLLMTGVLATAMLAGCGSAEVQEAASTAESAVAEVSEAAEVAESVVEEVAEEVTDYGTGDIKVWVAEAAVDFTIAQLAEFTAANPQFAGYTFTVEPVGEGDAANNMINDVTAGADVYTFAQDQLSRLVSAGAIESVLDENAAVLAAENDANAITAATVGGTLYAYPITADNTFFLYYDKSVVTDASTLEGVIEQCEAAGKNFYFQVDSAWYNSSFFYATGCKLDYTTDDNGEFTGSDVTYASAEGLVAFREMADMVASSSFQNGSSISEGTNIGAIVDGTWDSGAAKDLFGDNMGCAALPTFTGSDGKTYQMSGMGGYKLLGVKPQEDELKLAVCDAVALFLSSEDVQLARYKELGWGPSNTAAFNSAEVQADPIIVAVATQMTYAKPQLQYPEAFWNAAGSLGGDLVSKTLTADSSDDDLTAALQAVQDQIAVQ
ncbi:MAG: extracellular solute-binding protein [Lachnospiraceae bacterium]|nr:extracellular solute-binding protein [Lachnospiraceae bacterium]